MYRRNTQNCGINPNAPPCCTPGEDKGCIGNDDKVGILQLGTNPQNLKPGDEFEVQATVINNLDDPNKIHWRPMWRFTLRDTI